MFQLQHHSSSENSGLISFRIDWFDLLAVQGTLKSSSTPQFKSINSLVLSFLLTLIQDSWKNHSFDYTDLSQQSDISAFHSKFVIAFSHLVLFVVKTPISYLLLRLHLISLSPSSTKVGV